MLIEFRVANYRSIGEEQVLSLLPDSKKHDFPENILSRGKYTALNAIALYGANASGKSNLLLAMSLLDKLVHVSWHSPSTATLPYDPFLLRKGLEKQPTKFEVTFVANDKRYRYGLKFYRNQVAEEWLYRKNTGREVSVFFREGDVIDVSSAFQGNAKLIDTAIEATRPNALFLSTCDMFNVEEAKEIFEWFRHFQMIDGLHTETVSTVTLWEDEIFRKKINDYMAKLGLDLVEIDVVTKEFDLSDLPTGISDHDRSRLAQQLSGARSVSIFAKHKVYSTEGHETSETQLWKFEERESAGTNKALHLSGPVLWTLSHGGVLIMDEIEAKLHPMMTLETINLFLDRDTNPKGAQLIFATHDTNLLTYSSLRRDQIYFAEKNPWESTELYSLSDVVYLDKAKERPDSDKEKRYFEGRYGAIPVLSDFHSSNLIVHGKEG